MAYWVTSQTSQFATDLYRWICEQLPCVWWKLERFFSERRGVSISTLFNFINADSSVKCSCDNVANLLVIDSNLESIYAIAFQLNGVWNASIHCFYSILFRISPQSAAIHLDQKRIKLEKISPNKGGSLIKQNICSVRMLRHNGSESWVLLTKMLQTRYLPCNLLWQISTCTYNIYKPGNDRTHVWCKLIDDSMGGKNPWKQLMQWF